jgi:hypothetical protein
MSWARIRNAYRVRPGYWFAQKRYGWGVVPATWQGWGVMLGVLALARVIAKVAEHRSALYQLLFVPLFAGALWLCWLKTDGGWKWRWGDRE